MNQEAPVSLFRLSEPGTRNIVTSRPGYPIIVVDGPAGFNPIVVQASKWQGAVRISIRQHYSPKADSKTLLPSKRGMDLAPPLALKVAEAIYLIVDKLWSEGPSPEQVAVEKLGAVATEIEEDIPF